MGPNIWIWSRPSIADNSDSNTKSYLNWAFTYEAPDGYDGGEWVCGVSFQTTEIEVFSLASGDILDCLSLHMCHL